MYSQIQHKLPTYLCNEGRLMHVIMRDWLMIVLAHQKQLERKKGKGRDLEKGNMHDKDMRKILSEESC